MSKSFPAFRPLTHGQWLSPPSFRPRSHMLPNVHICWMNQWCGGGCQIEWDFPLPCSLPMASLPPQSSRARRVGFWSEEECCPGFCCQGCQRLVFPTESNLPPTFHSVNLETHDELSYVLLKYLGTVERGPHHLVRGQHACFVYS